MAEPAPSGAKFVVVVDYVVPNYDCVEKDCHSTCATCN